MSMLNIFLLLTYTNLQSERQQIDNLKLLHKKEITNKEECIKKLQEKSSIEENKKIIELQNEFEQKIKSMCYYCY